ncbi:ATP-binding protein [Vitreoscilla massiliensis]|uniref:ATP-binding protein n=1 Tax=Vitreoscilla massiliensis TaxID=1689272 RepID=A0ABY4E133_9NEIS|nr:ATP-binding protein [Vitreoscilla massiliensis]UOO89497.1 ATP-binding protein [Vitreoscilla massiliensis]
MAGIIKSLDIQEDGVSRLAKSSPERAIAELIWNGLDADANNITVQVNLNDLHQSIIVQDDGSGINYKVADGYLHKVGGSWKKLKDVTGAGRTLHGEKGEGRFKAFSIGRYVQWKTIFKEDKKLFEFDIASSKDEITKIQISELRHSLNKKTGTIVEITELHDAHTVDRKSNIFSNLDNLIDKLCSGLIQQDTFLREY